MTQPAEKSLVPAIIRIGLIITVPLLVGLVTLVFLYLSFIAPKDSGDPEPILFEIAQGKPLKEICSNLQEKGLIKYEWSVCLMARIKKTDDKINAGEYQLSPAMSPQEILRKLVAGEVYKRTVTIKEGVSMRDVGKLIEEAGIITKAEWDAGVVNPELLKIANIPANSFEGYLFPETYYFSRPTTARQIIFTMVEQGEKHWAPYFTEQMEKLGTSRHEILTLASIVEKESGKVDEQPLISAVFHNRLKVGMKLQADPTVIYGIPDFDGNLTKEDLLTPNAYNTYTNFGLPPGPIGNPGESAIRAALFPEPVPYLYFVADGSGGHVFSKTLEEHNDAVDLYQRKRGKRAGAANRAPAAQPTP